MEKDTKFHSILNKRTMQDLDLITSLTQQLINFESCNPRPVILQFC